MVLNSQHNIHSEKEQKKYGTSWKDKTTVHEVIQGLIKQVWKTKNILIAGYGVVGSAFDKILTDADYPHDICDPYVLKGKKLNEYYHTIHICFPCYFEDKFIDNVIGYIYAFHPDYIIIHSTIGVHTLEKIWKRNEYRDVKLFHAPVRGVEDEGAAGIKRFKTFIGGINPNYDLSLDYYLDNLGLNWEWVKSYKESALGKIVGTSWYGMIIAFANQIQKICDEEGIDFDQAYTQPMFTDEIGRIYFKHFHNDRAEPGYGIDRHMIERPVNEPGVIGGHCVMENLKFLPEKGLVSWIEDMNDYMKNRTKLNDEEDDIQSMEDERDDE